MKRRKTVGKRDSRVRRVWPNVVTPRREQGTGQRATAERRRKSAAFATGKSSLDGGVLTSTAVLMGLGVVMIYSTTAPMAMDHLVPPHFLRHLVALGLALSCAAIAFHLPLLFWRRIACPLWITCVVLLVLTLVVGIEVKGSSRWLVVPLLGVRFQPAELAKLAAVLAVAATLSRSQERETVSNRQIQGAAGFAVIPAALLLRQPDLGNAALLVVLVGLLVFVAGAPLRRLALPGLGAAIATALFVSGNGYARRRVTGFLHPWERASSEGFQLVQSFVAFGRGGAAGVGIGDGRQKLGYLPEVHTDFILSALGEELGLVGVLVVLGAFAALAIAGLRIAGRARDPFALLVAFGMTTLLVIPAAINAAVVMGVLPTTGFTLPFLSYGRVSLITCGLAVGILLRIGAVEAAPQEARVAGAARRGLVHT